MTPTATTLAGEITVSLPSDFPEADAAALHVACNILVHRVGCSAVAVTTRSNGERTWLYAVIHCDGNSVEIDTNMSHLGNLRMHALAMALLLEELAEQLTP